MSEPLRSLAAPPAALLWDVDGTLTDSTALIAEALDYIYRKHFGRTLSYDERRGLIGTPLRAQIRVFGEPADLGADEDAMTADFIHFYEQWKHREVILYDVIAILKRGYAAGIPTALVTSKNREELANTLPRLGIADSISLAVTADDIVNPKPAPDGILKALDGLGIRADGRALACYIGDTRHDLQAARDAGVIAVGVTWGAAGAERIAVAKPDYSVDSPAELSRLLLGTPSD